MPSIPRDVNSYGLQYRKPSSLTKACEIEVRKINKPSAITPITNRPASRVSPFQNWRSVFFLFVKCTQKEASLRSQLIEDLLKHLVHVASSVKMHERGIGDNAVELAINKVREIVEIPYDEALG